MNKEGEDKCGEKEKSRNGKEKWGEREMGREIEDGKKEQQKRERIEWKTVIEIRRIRIVSKSKGAWKREGLRAKRRKKEGEKGREKERVR